MSNNEPSSISQASPVKQMSNQHDVRITVGAGDETVTVKEDINTALLNAAATGRLDIVKCLWKHGVNVNTLQNGSTPLIASSKNGHVDVVEFLCLVSGADWNQRDAHGVPPLVYASTHGYTNIVQLLCDCGADVNLKGRLGTTALHEAVMSGNVELVKTLISAHASVDVKNCFHQTPEEIAISLDYTSIVRLLRKKKLQDLKGSHRKKLARHLMKSTSSWPVKTPDVSNNVKRDVGYLGSGSDTDRSAFEDFRTRPISTTDSEDQGRDDSSGHFTDSFSDSRGLDFDDLEEFSRGSKPRVSAGALGMREKESPRIWETPSSPDEYTARAPRGLLARMLARRESRDLPAALSPKRPRITCSRHNSFVQDGEGTKTTRRQLQFSPEAKDLSSLSDEALLASDRRAFSTETIVIPTTNSSMGFAHSEDDMSGEEPVLSSMSLDSSHFYASSSRTSSQSSLSQWDETEPRQVIVKKHYHIKKARIYWTQPAETNAISIQKARNVAVHGSITSIESGNQSERVPVSSSSDDSASSSDDDWPECAPASANIESQTHWV